MKSIIYTLAICILAVSCRGGSCKCSDVPFANLRVDFQWGDSQPLPEQMSVLFYPTSQGVPFLDFIDSQGSTINVFWGEYSIIAFNSDTQGILYRNESSYNTIEAYTQNGKSPIVSEPVMQQPDNTFYTAQYPNLELQKSLGYKYSIMLHPQRATSRVDFKFSRIEGLQYIQGIRIAITGMSSAIRLYDNRLSDEKMAISPQFNRGEESLSGSFTIFGDAANQNVPHQFIIQFKHGSEIVTKSYDVTQMMVETGAINIIDHLVFDKVDIPTEGFNPGIEDWDREDIEI